MVKFNKKVILVGVLVFAIATAFLASIRDDETGVIGGIQIFESETRLSEDMTPIVVDETSPFYDAFKAKDRVNVLLLGVNEGMTDVIMLCSYDMENQYVNIISVPRDTFYYRKGWDNNYAGNKINAIYHSEGVAALATAVSDTLYGMPIHYYAVIEYEDIRKVMRVIGGIPVNVPFNMDYDDPTAEPELHIHIKKGNQTIDASNVMEYLRYRKGYANGDIGRIQIHQEFVKKVLRECLRAGNILDVMKVCLENVESDVTYNMAISVATKAIGLSGDRINSYILPGTDTMLHGLSFWQGNDTKIKAMLEEIYAIGSGTEDDISVVKEIKLIEVPKANLNFLPKGEGSATEIWFDADGNIIEPGSGSEEGEEGDAKAQ